ncbi:TIGR01440 family protein [Lederbergia sp. NSJ-179]|uniref:TIGR01440 family protein n=1 Tax=Lederbergia sp. NSJ-179 TaxID=2931402 RepID=UPI001FD31F3F|nr:TIGR01440 family protein [Lederbergia sp. NSJ-179]MCJ7840567.1 TIGR01440 family protein [Lederbergia sp. NSJ-179]
MTDISLEKWAQEIEKIIQGCKEHFQLGEGKVLVIGCSTSEIIGEKIGTAGTMEVAAILFEALQKYAKENHFALAFQCCEHLNRALVIEKKTALEKNWEEVSVIPAPHAGGSMATFAYQHLEDPIVVESIQADAGIDIGDTFIGMHLKSVVVPVRIEQKQLGRAHVTIAITRPKLIGGARAIYE